MMLQRLGRVLHMDRARTMTGFAALHLELVARIEFEDLRMHRMRPVRVFLGVTGDAGLLADIARLLRGRRRRELSHALQRRRR